MKEPYFTDISHHQSDFPNHPIDWVKVKASGISHVYIKASESNYFTDVAFATNWIKSKANGILRGAYLFFRATATGRSQAAKFASVVGQDQGELAPAVDVEDGNGVPSTILTDRLRECLLEVERLFGQKPVIYTSAGAWDTLTTRPAWVKDYKLWLAAPDKPIPPLPTGATEWEIHQYSWTGIVPGIDGKVDLDRFNVTPPQNNTDILSELGKIDQSVSVIRGEL